MVFSDTFELRGQEIAAAHYPINTYRSVTMRTPSFIALLPLLLSACTPGTPAGNPIRVNTFVASGVATRADWPSYNGSLEGGRFSNLSQITPANASQLERACTFDSGEQMSMQSGPVVVDGVLYFTTDTSTCAIDAATCRRKWHTARPYRPIGFLKNNHGVAYMGGRLFRVHGGVHAYAIDAASGRVLWDVSFKKRDGEGAPMAPIAWNGMVFVGNSGGEMSSGAPIGAGIITYEVGGQQYIAVAGGSISPIWPLDAATSRVTIFRLRQ
jgi:glucose dehydrogenase